jgi:glycosyltransferase involved in cell wall biosynthesis
MITAITPYGRTGGSSRVRVFEWLDRTGAEYVVNCYLGRHNADPQYLARHPVHVLRAEHALRAIAASRPSCLLLHREASPLSRGALERKLIASAGMSVYDFDDALQEDHGEGGVLRRWAPKSRKALRSVRAVDRVIAGNSVLADWASRYNDDVVVIPSCVSPHLYHQKQDYRRASPPRVVWIGSADNEQHLALIAPVLLAMHKGEGLRITIVGTTSPTLGPLEQMIDRLSWSPARQHRVLADADIGIMPLPDDPYSRGKCGYKLLQYAAAGLPFVASPVGVNAAMLQQFGMPAAIHQHEWSDAISWLLGSDTTRETLGGRARRIVERDYSYETWLPAWETAVGLRARPAPSGAAQ